MRKLAALLLGLLVLGGCSRGPAAPPPPTPGPETVLADDQVGQLVAALPQRSPAALDARTMQARTVPGLYFVGEVVDVTGWLGGYNFQWAWSSGWAAGQDC